ncbi:MAG: cytochrome P450, partial [Actinomycetota bacterium]
MDIAERAARFPIGASITDGALAADLHGVLARLREHEPVSWVPALGGWLVTPRDLVVDVMRDAERFTVDDPRFSTGQVLGPSMLSLDGAEHARHRQPFADAFRPPEVRNRYAEAVDAAARRRVT